MSTPTPQANEATPSPAGASSDGEGGNSANLEAATTARKSTQTPQNGTPAIAAPAASSSSVSSSGGSGSIARKRLAQERAAWRRDHPAGFSAKYAPMADGSVGQDIMKWICKVPGKKVSNIEGHLGSRFPAQRSSRPFGATGRSRVRQQLLMQGEAAGSDNLVKTAAFSASSV